MFRQATMLILSLIEPTLGSEIIHFIKDLQKISLHFSYIIVYLVGNRYKIVD